jgi:hypothetical protein
MSSDEHRNRAAHLLLERVELKRDIANVKADLLKRADAFVKLGTLLRSSPQIINLDDQQMSSDYAARAQKFSSDEFDSKRVAILIGELRKKTDRLTAVEEEIRGMGYSPE